jgi:tetratricopeptide (TPR) repeat protein
LPDGDVSPRYKASGRIAVSRIAWAADRYDDARTYCVEAQQIFDAMGDEAGSALADMLTGFLDRGDGRLDEAEQHFQRALTIGQRIGETYVEAGGLSGLGSIAMDRGDLERARSLKEQSLIIYERLGDQWIIGLILWGITGVATAQKDYARARSALDAWTRITRELGNRWILPYILESHADLALANGQPQQAARLFGATEASRENLGTQLLAAEKAHHEASVAALKQVLPEAELQEAWEAGRNSSPWDLIESARQNP